MSFTKTLKKDFNLLRNVHILMHMDNPYEMPSDVYNIAENADLKFVFKQAESRVAETTKEADIVYTKSVTIVSLSISFLAALLSYIASNFKYDIKTFIAIALVFALWMIISVLKGNIVPTQYLGVGSNPRDLLKIEMYTKHRDCSYEWHMLATEIINYQRRIDINSKNNKERNNNLKSAFHRIYAIPFYILFAIAVYFFSLLLFS